MASTKRQPPTENEPEPAKRPKPGPNHRVLLNPVDCDLDFNIDGNGLQGSSLCDNGFAYCWSGARASVGISGGKYCFGCRVTSFQSVEMEDTAPEQRNLCRVGVSRGGDVVGGLGETKLSFGYGGTGKFSNASLFSDYGERFGLGDVIVCAVNLEEKPLACISFSKNGRSLGAAVRFDAGGLGIGKKEEKLDWECGVFPHVLLKNVGMEMMFSVEDGLVPDEGFKAWECAVEDGNSVMGPSVCDPEKCEVMMMVGLPASGKSTWAEKWVKEHPEKRYVVLGTNMVLDQMKVPGLLRKQNYGERFERLMSRATEIFNTLLSRAANTPRNYILDQTNVYKNARKRKLLPFKQFKKIAVVVFPSPEEVQARSMKRVREMGKEVPADAVNEMLANYVLPVSKDMPRSDELFDEVMFVELNREESQRHLDEMKRELAHNSDLSSSNSLASSPYTFGNSVQSYPCSQSYGASPVRPYSTPSPQYQGVSAVHTGNWNNSNSSVAPHYYQSHLPNQVNSYQTHQGAVPVGTAGSYQGYQAPPSQLAVTPQGTYSGYSSSYNATTTSGISPYNSYGAGYGNTTNPYPTLAVQSSLIGGPVSSFTGNAPGYYGGAGYSSHAAPQPPIAPTFHPSPCPPAYGGAPYGTPPTRPQAVSYPVNTPYPDGYAPPGSGYY